MSSIAFTAASISLARQILKKRVAAFDLPMLEWDELTRADQEWHIHKAAELLSNMSPDGYQHTLDHEPHPRPVLAFRREA